MASNTRKSSKAITSENKWHSFKMKAHWLSRSAIHKLGHSKRVLLVVLLLASSAVALTSAGIWRAMLSGNAAAFVSQSVPATMIAGETYAVTVSMLNQGTTTWTPGQAYRLGAQNPHDNTIWMMTTNRVNLLPGESVSPGATATFSFMVTAPSSPGSYNFQWRMVQEFVEWFGATTPNVAVQVVPRPKLTKLKEYVYAGGRLITSEEKSCASILSPTIANPTQGGGPGSFNVSTSSGCSWSAAPSASWITITGGLNGVGGGIVQYSVAPNSGPQRVGTITVNGQSFTITQAPSSASCIYSLSKTSDPLNSYQAGSGFVDLTVGDGCEWFASSNDGWITIASEDTHGFGPAVGSKTINYSYTANNSGAQRTGSIIVGGQTLTITQPPNQATCSYSINTSNYNANEQGGNNSLTMTTGVGCAWTAVSNATSWLTVTPSGSGPGPISYSITPNNSGAQRTGLITTTGGRTLTVTQPPIQASCAFALSPSSWSYPIEGGTGSFNITTGAGCQWFTTIDGGWIRIDSGSSGISNGQPAPVSFTVLANNGVPRTGQISVGNTGQISVGNKAFTIAQVGFATLNPSAWQTPCDTPYGEDWKGYAVSNPLNTGHGQTTVGSSGDTDYWATCMWQGFQLGGQALSMTLKVDWSEVGNTNGLAVNNFMLQYSLDGGANWNTAFNHNQVHFLGSGTFQVSLPPSQNISQIRVRDYLEASGADSNGAYITASVSNIRLEVTAAPPVISNVASGDKSAPATPRRIIQQRQWYPKAAARPLGRAGLALLVTCGVLVFLLRARWRQARRRYATNVAGVMSRMHDQIASRLGELFRIAAATYEKLQLVTGFGKRLLAGTYDKLKVVGHFLSASLPIFKVVSRGGAFMRLGGQKLAGLLPERVRAIAGRALQSWRGSGLARLKPAVRRALAIALIVILATPTDPAQADSLTRAARAAWRTMSAAAKLHGASSDSRMFDRLIKALGKRPGKVVSAAAQAEQVDQLQICPTHHVMFVGERYTITPVALAGNDTDGWHVVNRAGMSWTKPEDNIAKVSSFGEVEAVGVGTTTVTVLSGSASKPITIEVRAGMRPTGSNQQADLDTGDCAAEQASMFAPQSAASASAQQKSATGASAQQSLIGDDGVLYDQDPPAQLNSLAAQFRNAVGNPRFMASSQSSAAVPTNTQLGSDNYQFNVPVVGVGGRGVSANIGMTLNSRVWNTDNGKITFNYVGAYPGPGWSIGFGKIIRNYNATATGDGGGIGSPNNPGDYLLIASNGTRIRMAAKYDTAAGRWFHESDDGSFLKFNPISGELSYPDGSRTIYSSVNGCLLPTAMIGANGGAITMSYRDYCEGSCTQVFRHRTALNAVRDTMGRYVTFHYYGDAGNEYQVGPGHPAGELAAIKAPDTSSAQQEVIRVEYQPINLKYDFDPGLQVMGAPTNNTPIQVVWRICYPQTGKGFLFQDYSSYGMPRKISSRMRMKDAGGITDGVEMAYTKYNYTTISDDPSDPPYARNQVGHLSDFPQFTQREEWWLGKTDDNGNPATEPTRYIYSRTTDASKEVDTINYDGRNYKEVTTIGADSSNPLSFGKVTSVEQKRISPEAPLGKQVLTYVTGPDGEVEVGTVETFDETEQSRQVQFGYGNYGRVIDKSEYGYKQAGVYPLIRRTHYEYKDDQSYKDARFLRLVTSASVFDGSNALIAKTVTTYDDYAAMGGLEFYGLVKGQYPPNHDDTYIQNKLMRGNATAVTIFSQFSPSEASTTRHVKYDIFGNVVQAEVSCCVVKSFGFSSATAYSQPDWVRSGPDPGLNVKTNYHYDFVTGLLLNETDPDGVETDYDYDNALRLKHATVQAIGLEAVTKFDQDGNGNDLLTYISQKSYADQGTTKVITSKQWFDGAGRVIRAGTGTGAAPGGYDTTATIYDSWGRVWKQSNPYSGDADGNTGDTKYWTTNTYDDLSRVKLVTLPGDNQTIQTDYIGAVTTVTDTVGRQRRSEVDGLGRLVKVTEQNPANGNLEWETSYSYDALNNLKLIQSKQGGQVKQERTFDYDAKGRLKSEKTPEAGLISYTYTDFDAVSTRTDARNVVTTYTYGPLNLLTKVRYDTASAPGVIALEDVNIDYKQSSTGMAVKIGTVKYGDGGTTWSESYDYDGFGRLQSRTRWIDGIRYLSQYGYNAAGQMTAMTYPSGKRVKVGHDDRGRLSDLKKVDASGATQETYLSGIQYRADGLISNQNLGDNTSESFNYSNDRLQLTSQKVMKGGSSLLDLTYEYAAAAGKMGSGTRAGNSGQLVSVTGTINNQPRNQEFTYDNVGRLVTATGLSTQGSTQVPWARRYEYDLYGNRTGVFEAVSGGNRLQNTMIGQANGMNTNRIDSVNGIAFRYDASGNVTWDGARTSTYDAESRIVRVDTATGGSETYGYDANNHRVKKVVGGVVTHYIWEGNKVIAEYEIGGSNTQGTGTRYYHQDRLSTRVITDGAGNVMETTDHLPFGEELGIGGEGDKHKFTTYERDSTELDYAVNRHYDSRQGRFNQVDPLGMRASILADPQSLNLYNYVRNDPVNNTDPSGLYKQSQEYLDYLHELQVMMDFLDFYFRSMEFYSGGGQVSPIELEPADGQQPNKSGHTGSSDRTVPVPPKESKNNNPCEKLAENAQLIADAAIKSGGGVADDSAVDVFDETLSYLYIGTRIDTYQHAIDADRQMNAEGKRIAGSKWITSQDGWGQSDFKDKYQETGTWFPNPDQTHHFVAYMSAGINGMAIIAEGHSLLDDNTADKKLGGQAFQMGTNLRFDPNRLRTIGDDIRRLICK